MWIAVDLMNNLAFGWVSLAGVCLTPKKLSLPLDSLSNKIGRFNSNVLIIRDRWGQYFPLGVSSVGMEVLKINRLANEPCYSTSGGGLFRHKCATHYPGIVSNVLG